MAFGNLGGQLSYWRTTSGTEVDFVWTRGRRAVGIEVKASARWRPEYGAALASLLEEGVLTAAHGIYTGAVELMDGPIRVWPLHRFFGELASGGILA
jgi:predicted AAA+ superfamily ATPase